MTFQPNEGLLFSYFASDAQLLFISYKWYVNSNTFNLSFSLPLNTPIISVPGAKAVAGLSKGHVEAKVRVELGGTPIQVGRVWISVATIHGGPVVHLVGENTLLALVRFASSI